MGTQSKSGPSGALVAVMLVVVGCSTPNSTPTAKEDPTSASTASATPTATAIPSPSAHVEKPAPPELIGSWTTTLDGPAGGPVSLTLDAGSYRVRRPPDSASGKISVQGDVIEFFEGSICGGRGKYRWSLADGLLTFTAISESCGGRSDVLDGQTYER